MVRCAALTLFEAALYLVTLIVEYFFAVFTIALPPASKDYTFYSMPRSTAAPILFYLYFIRIR